MKQADQKIAWIATGGTLAGVGSAERYEAARLAPAQLLQLWSLSLPQVIPSVPFAIDSKDATPEHWFALYQAVNAALADPEVCGVVITHGTDTLEESAAFLALALAPDRPVVLTGALRPATDPCSDARANFLAALQRASSPATPAGVWVSFNQALLPALGVRKVASETAAALAAFAALDPKVYPTPLLAPQSKPKPLPTPWPRVALLAVAAYDDPQLLTDLTKAQGYRGVVLTLPGAGSVPQRWYAAIRQAAQQALIVRASRCSLVPVSPHPLDEALGTLPAGALSAAQARVAAAFLLDQRASSAKIPTINSKE